MTNLAEVDNYFISVMLIIAVGMRHLSLYTLSLKTYNLNFVEKIDWDGGRVGTFHPFTTMMKIDKFNYAFLVTDESKAEVFRLRFDNNSVGNGGSDKSQLLVLDDAPEDRPLDLRSSQFAAKNGSKKGSQKGGRNMYTGGSSLHNSVSKMQSRSGKQSIKRRSSKENDTLNMSEHHKEEPISPPANNLNSRTPRPRTLSSHIVAPFDNNDEDLAQWNSMAAESPHWPKPRKSGTNIQVLPPMTLLERRKQTFGEIAALQLRSSSRELPQLSFNEPYDSVYNTPPKQELELKIENAGLEEASIDKGREDLRRETARMTGKTTGAQTTQASSTLQPWPSDNRLAIGKYTHITSPSKFASASGNF